MKLLLVPGISTLKFPRLMSMQAKSVGKNRAIQLVHYTRYSLLQYPHTRCTLESITLMWQASLVAAEQAET